MMDVDDFKKTLLSMLQGGEKNAWFEKPVFKKKKKPIEELCHKEI